MVSPRGVEGGDWSCRSSMKNRQMVIHWVCVSSHQSCMGKVSSSEYNRIEHHPLCYQLASLPGSWLPNPNNLSLDRKKSGRAHLTLVKRQSGCGPSVGNTANTHPGWLCFLEAAGLNTVSNITLSQPLISGNLRLKARSMDARMMFSDFQSRDFKISFCNLYPLFSSSFLPVGATFWCTEFSFVEISADFLLSLHWFIRESHYPFENTVYLVHYDA